MPRRRAARVIEMPTPRWSAYDPPEPGVTTSADLLTTTHERACTSPTWYTPGS